MKILNFKNKNGITLIALVITIIVLLILVGITISMISGNNSIIERAKQAKDDSIVGQEKEQVGLAYMSASVRKLGTDVDENEMQTELDSLAGVNKTKVTTNADETLNVLFYDTEHNYNVNSGIITRLADGIGTDNGGSSTTISTLREGDHVYYKDKDNQEVECIVLYDSENENYDTYGVQITTKDPIGTVTLGSTTSLEDAISDLNNAISILNGHCEEYRVANLSSISSNARCIGSIPNNKNAKNTSILSDYEDYDLEVGEAKYYDWNQDMGYSLSDGSPNYTEDVNKLMELNCVGSGYWLASRGYFYIDSNGRGYRSCYYAFWRIL